MWGVRVCVSVCVYNGLQLSHKENEIKLFAATCMDLEIIILSEVKKTNIICYHSCGI